MKSVDPLEAWFAAARFGILATCLIAACFLPVLLGSQTFFFRDYAIFSYPLAAYHKECFLRGDIPLWNPYNSCGLPFLAQWNTMVFYPLSIIYLALPLPWSLNFFCLFHFWLGGMGMYFLARAWTQNNLAGATAGLTFMFSGVLLSCLKWPNNIAALGWMPWVVLATDRAFKGGLRGFGIAALAGGAQMLAGAPEVILLTWVFLAAWTCFRFLSEKPRSARMPLIFLALIVVVAGLSAVQLAPFLDLLLQSQRGANSTTFAASEWPMPFWGWANFFVPLFRAFKSYHGVYAQPEQYWISTYYVPISVLLLAALALFREWRGRVWLLAGLLLLSLWMALGENGKLYSWLRAIVPGVSMLRFPIKFVVLAAFVLPLLAAYGIAQLATDLRAVRKGLLISALALATIMLTLLVFSELRPFMETPASVVRANVAGRIFFLVASLVSILWFVAASTRRHLAAGSLLLMTTLDGLTHAPWHNPTAPSWVYSGTIAEMESKPRLGQSRAMTNPEARYKLNHLKFDNPAEDVLAARIALFCNVNLLDSIPKVDGFYAISPGKIAEIEKAIYRGTNSPPAGILDFLGVSQINVPGSWSKWQTRSTAVPLFTSPPQIRFAERPLDEILKPEFDPRNEALIEAGTALPTGPTGTLARAEISAIDWKAEHISFTATSSGTSAVAIAQTGYHWWRAFVNDRPTEILPVNHAFQAILLPQGAHSVRLEYQDRGFKLGAIVSAIFSVIVISSILFPRKPTA